MWLEAENYQPEVEGTHENDATKTSNNSAISWGTKILLDEKDWHGNNRKHEPDMKVEKEISEVEVPWFYAVNFWTSSFPTQDVVFNEVPRNYS